MDYDVTIDRDKYIGGSDIAAIMGISPFKTRYELLLEKSGLKNPDFSGNRYTEYGKVIEPQIRDHINKGMPADAQFEPNCVINGDIRCHTDGFNGYCVLEIKSTSQIYETVEEYKIYLVQLVKYMEENKVENGLLAVYERPEDFNPVFDPQKLRIFEVNAGEHESLLQEVNHEIQRFRGDLARLKENPLLCEEDFQPSELVAISNKVVALETRMAEFKVIEAQYKQMKQDLYRAMQKYDVKSWQTYNGTRITRIDETKGTVETIAVFDEDRFSRENPELYQQYIKQVQKKTSGKAGYVRITLKE